MSHRVALIPGDGTGPEIMAATCRAIEATGVAIEWDVQQASASVIEREGSPCPNDPSAVGTSQFADAVIAALCDARSGP